MSNIRTLEEYKEEVFDKLDEQQKLEWLYEMSMQINRAIEYIKVNHTLKCTKPNVIFEITNEKLDKLLEILGDSSNE